MTHDLSGGLALLSLALKKLLKLPRIRYFRLRYVGCCLAFLCLTSSYATDQTFAMSSEGFFEQEQHSAQIDILVAKLLDQGMSQEEVLAILDDDTLTNQDVINIFMALIGEGIGDLWAMDCDINQRHVEWCFNFPFGSGYYCTEYCKVIESEPTPSIPETPSFPPERPVVEPEPTPDPPSEPLGPEPPPVFGSEPPPESGGSPWWKFWGD